MAKCIKRAGIVFFVIDYNRVQEQEKPIFCIKNPAGIMNDGGTVEYFGLGYKVIDFHTIAGFDDIKIGTWFMDYNDFNEEMKVYEEKFEKELRKNDYNIGNDVFKATIKEIREYNGITTILIKGLESNDINYRGKFIFAIRDDTILTWRGIEIKSYDLVQGNNIAITFVDKELDDVLPTPIKEVIKVQLLDDKIASKS